MAVRDSSQEDNYPPAREGGYNGPPVIPPGYPPFGYRPPTYPQTNGNSYYRPPSYQPPPSVYNHPPPSVYNHHHQRPPTDHRPVNGYSYSSSNVYSHPPTDPYTHPPTDPYIHPPKDPYNRPADGYSHPPTDPYIHPPKDPYNRPADGYNRPADGYLPPSHRYDRLPDNRHSPRSPPSPHNTQIPDWCHPPSDSSYSTPREGYDPPSQAAGYSNPFSDTRPPEGYCPPSDFTRPINGSHPPITESYNSRPMTNGSHAPRVGDLPLNRSLPNLGPYNRHSPEPLRHPSYQDCQRKSGGMDRPPIFPVHLRLGAPRPPAFVPLESTPCRKNKKGQFKNKRRKTEPTVKTEQISEPVIVVGVPEDSKAGIVKKWKPRAKVTPPPPTPLASPIKNGSEGDNVVVYDDDPCGISPPPTDTAANSSWTPFVNPTTPLIQIDSSEDELPVAPTTPVWVPALSDSDSGRSYKSDSFSPRKEKPFRIKRRGRKKYPRSCVPFIDSHCHLDYLFVRDSHYLSFAAYIRRHDFPGNFAGCITCFCDPPSILDSDYYESVLSEEGVWGTFGVHPHNAASCTPAVLAAIERALDHPSCVALGEVGMDYSRGEGEGARQKAALERQLRLAVRAGKPVVIHARGAEAEVYDVLKRELPSEHRIHFHCFSGSLSMAVDLAEDFPNLYYGITGLVTFIGSNLGEVIREVPFDRLLIETDSPYLRPYCHRDIDQETPRSANPGMGVLIAEEIARIREISLDDVLIQMRENVTEMYGI